jgi:hypothetical protein
MADHEPPPARVAQRQVQIDQALGGIVGAMEYIGCLKRCYSIAESVMRLRRWMSAGGKDQERAPGSLFIQGDFHPSLS